LISVIDRNYSRTGRGWIRLIFGLLKEERLALVETVWRAEKRMSLLASRRKIAPYTTEGARASVVACAVVA
jgi:hypothetical protein